MERTLDIQANALFIKAVLVSDISVLAEWASTNQTMNYEKPISACQTVRSGLMSLLTWIPRWSQRSVESTDCSLQFNLSQPSGLRPLMSLFMFHPVSSTGKQWSFILKPKHSPSAFKHDYRTEAGQWRMKLWSALYADERQKPLSTGLEVTTSPAYIIRLYYYSAKQSTHMIIKFIIVSIDFPWENIRNKLNKAND